jgi:hypothetical protein
MHKEVVSIEDGEAAGMEPIERVVAVDWSGRVDAAGQRRHIWAGVWTAAASRKASGSGAGDPGKVTLEAGRTRAELVEWLIELGRETPRMVVGLDCCFSFPAWFLEEHGCATVFEFWRQVAAGKGEEWLHRDCGDARFWGKTGSGRVGRRPAEFCGEGMYTSLRRTDMENKVRPLLPLGASGEAEAENSARADAALRIAMRGITAKSPFQIGGSGSVGTGSLRAMPALLRLRQAGFRVWPFEDAVLTGAPPRPLVIEMYSRLLTGAVAKSNAAARKAYLARRRKQEAGGSQDGSQSGSQLWAGLSRAVLAKALGSEDGFDALVSALEIVRWREEFPGLRRTRDAVMRLEGITWRPGVRG